jgi:hypothetical protein
MRSKLIPTMAATEISGVDNRELSAAILTAGMLPTLPIPRSRAEGGIGPVAEAEGAAIPLAVGHAIGLYRSVLEGLGVDPFAGLPGHDNSARAARSPHNLR